MTKTTAHPNRVERAARLVWVPIQMMRVSPLGQRELNPARVDRLAATLDLEQLGTPTVNKREGHFYIIDGQHRVRALEAIGYGDQQIQCWCYEDMTAAEEAEMFLRLNDVLAVNVFPKFKVAVEAGRPEETEINRVVKQLGLRVSQDKGEGAVGAVGTLKRVYKRSDSNTLARSLLLIKDAYGTAGFTSAVIDGIGHLCQRYNGELDVPTAVQKLGNAHGGVNGLLGRAEVIRRQTGNAKGLCVAAAAVDFINSGRGGKKLPAWWKGDE
jgi:hypothetical protein